MSAQLGSPSSKGGGDLLCFLRFLVFSVKDMRKSAPVIAQKEGPTTFACKSKNVDMQDWYISI